MDVLALWGKTVKGDPATWHPAVYHMLDAAHVARVLLEPSAPATWRVTLARALSCREEDALAAAPWFVALHDIGKVSQPFQELVPVQKARLSALGVPFSARSMITLTHPVVGAAAWPALAGGPVGALGDRLSLAMREVVAGHHGYWLKAGQALQARRQMASMEPRYWAEARGAAAEWLWARVPVDGRLPEVSDVSTAIMALSGFTILCDWLASDERFFPPCAGVPPEDYLPLSQARAHQAVAQTGFLEPALSAARTEFDRLFWDIATPRQLQVAVDDVPAEILREPVLAFFEAPTGEGKTEAALALAHRIGALRGTDALYYALPTMATSNAMYIRVNKHLQERLGLDARSRLVHGQAWLAQDDREAKVYSNGDDEEHPMLSWFGPLKKALLAPFGVGTIDQAELAVLNVRHVALRAAGLAGKVVILDEVHAYDVYMTTIIERLLTWLHAMGASVIVLSATLPLARRRALAEAWGGAELPADREECYPRLEVRSDAGRHVAVPPSFQKERPIRLGRLDLADDEADVRAAWLLAQVREGGCACWITNTVAQAQEMFRSLKKQAPEGLPLTLLHSRFPMAKREDIEKAIVNSYGPDSSGARHGIVVGTQVLEQSLDLDFDVMASDLAPIDLLLQRAGRLHRHKRDGRPTEEAVLWVNVARGPDGGEDLGVNAVIYHEYILRRTLLSLAGREVLNLPEDYRPLIEAVYTEEEPEEPALRAAWAKWLRDAANSRDEAELRLLPAPKPQEPFNTPAAELRFQEKEDSASWGVAQTRLGAESVTLLPLERQRGRQARLASIDLTVALDAECSRETALTILRQAIRVSHRGLVYAMKQDDAPHWALFKHPLLGNIHPLWLSDGRTRLGKDGMEVVLDSGLGLVIERAEKGEES